MADKEVGKRNVRPPKGQRVYAQRYTFELLAAMMIADPEKGTVMMVLLARMDEDGAMKIPFDTLAQLCRHMEDRLEHANNGLIQWGWIHSVRRSEAERGVLECVVSSTFTQSDYNSVMKN